MGKEIENENWVNKVRAEENRQKDRLNSCPFRMKYHIMPPVGWLNDPNGLCQFQGTYHAYFQYSPLSVNGGGGFWGHCTSQDLLHWQYQDPVLTTDRPEDRSGVYSGSALIEDGTMYLFYTGNVKLPGDYDYIDEGRISSQLMVSSKDGQHMSEKTVLLGMKDYPEDMTAHIRDPKVWKDQGHYYMILGARKRDFDGDRRRDTGCALVYVSDDKKQWKLDHEILPEENFGYMWECPDLFELDGEKILSYCPQGLPAEPERCQNLYQSGYSILTNGETPEKTFREWDLGFDFYAPQTFEDENGRRILIGWAGVPDTIETHRNLSVQNGWQHCLTIPRELYIENGAVYQRPVCEIDTLSWKQEEGTHCRFEREMVKIETTLQEGIPAEIRIGTEENGLTIHMEADRIQMTFLNKKGEPSACGGGRAIRIGRTASEIRHALVLIDNSIAEIFVNDGEVVMTTRIYLEKPERMITVNGCRTCEIWKTEE